jgi:membrane protease YdiL (CAAX protease family)
MKLSQWALGAAAFLLLGSRLALPEDSAKTADVVTRTLLVMGAALLPALFVFWQNRPREIFSALAGLAIWPTAWWLMSLVNDALEDLFGAYLPPNLFRPDFWNDIWTPYVMSEVVLIPLALAILIWGVAARQHQKLWGKSLLFAGIFGFAGVLVFGQGMAGFFGYGLCGVIASITTLRTRSLWAGFATHATFMYANLGLLDELTREVVGKPYLGREWLTLILIGGFACLAILQILRFRTEDMALPALESSNSMLWVALLAFLIVAGVVTYDEIRQRREADRQPLQALHSAQNPDQQSQ